VDKWITPKTSLQGLSPVGIKSASEADWCSVENLPTRQREVDSLWISQGGMVDNRGINTSGRPSHCSSVDKLSTDAVDNISSLSTVVINCGKLINIFCG
jgi:hypothetical protein